jgi:hypothetical protein
LLSLLIHPSEILSCIAPSIAFVWLIAAISYKALYFPAQTLENLLYDFELRGVDLVSAEYGYGIFSIA